MPTLTITGPSRGTRAVDASAGLTLMEIIREAGFDELLAVCGGSCSCATCHIYVDPEWLERAGPPGPDESALLDSSDHREEGSRLSCQLIMTEALDGLRVMIAPET